MTPEERAEARRLVDAATPGTSVAWISYALRLARKTGLDFADIEPDLTLNAATETDAELFAASRTLVQKLLDALEEAMRERENFRKCYNGAIDGQQTLLFERTEITKTLRVVEQERDTARAQVETLAEALRWYENLARNNSFPSADSIEIWNDRGGRARAALKAAGVET